jgi:glycosyltransferase involved in cell wall biosynthesis
MAARLKVLMSAYACEPGRGSEPEVGWRWALQMARFHDVTVVTRANNRPVIEAALANHAGTRPNFIYYDLPAWVVWLKRRGLPVALYYFLWQAGVRRHLAQRLREFDLIHHVTFNSFRQPGLWWFCRKPVVLGPLGGGQVCPWRFLPSFGWQMIPEAFRSLSVIGSFLLPHVHGCFHFATRILVANRDTLRRIPKRYHSKVSSLLEAGIPSDQVQSPRAPRDGGAVRFIWVSRLEKIKACTLAIEAFSRAVKSEPDLQLGIVGDGPDAPQAKAAATQAGVSRQIQWHGRVAKNDIPRLLGEHDVFLFTSVRDTSGNVLLEAMSVGLPAITLRHHGAAEIATNETAVRVLPTDFNATATAIAEAMVNLARSPGLRGRLGAAGRNRILETYTWERKGEQMDALYREAVARTVSS